MSASSKNKSDATKPIAIVLTIGVHVSFAIIACFVTWTVIRGEEDPPQQVTAVWHEIPIVETATLPLTTESLQSPIQQFAKMPSIPKQKGEESIQLVEAPPSIQIPNLESIPDIEEIEFMGLDAVAAKRIVYVVDASGSMLLHLSSVISELERSIRQLHPKQEFGIIFFQQESAIYVPPKGKLQPASGQNIEKAIRWIRQSGKVIPSGSSNPMTAIKAGMRLKPNVMYLLSENITGDGKYAVSPNVILESLDALNPIDLETGIRRVQINCIQYLTQDPSGTMERIASIHGGTGGYTLIERGTGEKEGERHGCQTEMDCQHDTFCTCSRCKCIWLGNFK